MQKLAIMTELPVCGPLVPPEGTSQLCGPGGGPPNILLGGYAAGGAAAC